MVVVVVMMVVVMFFFVVVIIVMMVVVMFFLVVIIVVMMVVVMFFFFVVIIFMVMFYLVNPRSRRGYGIKVKTVGVHQFIQIHVTIVACDNLCLGLQCMDDLLDLLQLLCRHLRSLVEQDGVAEFYLLDNQVFNVFLTNILAGQRLTAAKLIAHTQCIDHGNNAVKAQYRVFRIFRTQGGDGADGLCDRCRLANTTRLYHDIVEALHGSNVFQLFHEIHL